MMFSSSMSVVEYYLLHRFPVPYGTSTYHHMHPLLISWFPRSLDRSPCIGFDDSAAAYFTGVAFVAAITGQHCVRKLIAWLGRASLIIFILASMIFVSALTLGTYVRTASIDRSIVHACPAFIC
jgi:fucose 4-O-acetylase-like acetyltransferase